MAFHSDFWLTAGTVAPVVGLAHVVNIGAYRRSIVELSRARDEIQREADANSELVLTALRQAPAVVRQARQEIRAMSEDDSGFAAMSMAMAPMKRVESTVRIGVGLAALALTSALVALLLQPEYDLGFAWPVAAALTGSMSLLVIPQIYGRRVAVAEVFRLKSLSLHRELGSRLRQLLIQYPGSPPADLEDKPADG